MTTPIRTPLTKTSTEDLLARLKHLHEERQDEVERNRTLETSILWEMRTFRGIDSGQASRLLGVSGEAVNKRIRAYARDRDLPLRRPDMDVIVPRPLKDHSDEELVALLKRAHAARCAAEAIDGPWRQEMNRVLRHLISKRGQTPFQIAKALGVKWETIDVRVKALTA